MKGATLRDDLTSKHDRISIHAPCEGSDQPKVSTAELDKISIHAPCEGSDLGLLVGDLITGDFNPRSL